MWARIADIAFKILTLGIAERKRAAVRAAEVEQDKLVRLREKLRQRTEEARRGR